MLECLVDGEIASQVSAGNHGLHFGDGLVETIAMRAGRPARRSERKRDMLFPIVRLRS